MKKLYERSSSWKQETNEYASLKILGATALESPNTLHIICILTFLMCYR